MCFAKFLVFLPILNCTSLQHDSMNHRDLFTYDSLERCIFLSMKFHRNSTKSILWVKGKFFDSANMSICIMESSFVPKSSLSLVDRLLDSRSCMYWKLPCTHLPFTSKDLSFSLGLRMWKTEILFHDFWKKQKYTHFPVALCSPCYLLTCYMDGSK